MKPPPALDHRPRVLMGPGPSEVSPRVLAAMSAPLLGHLDPDFLAIMDGLQAMLREVFRTENEVTLALPATGSAGMETAFANLVEPGDEAVIGVCGYFGGRMGEVATRCGARVTRVESPWGEPVDGSAMAETIGRVRPKVVAFVHAETSTGVLQPVEEIAAAAREAGSLVILDCVTSLGGCPVEVDGWGIDVAYSGSQKCLGAPPGLAPVSASARALDAIRNRKRPVQSYYQDLTLLADYWGAKRAYHHTAPALMHFALYEALRVVLEEGLTARFARHVANHEALVAGLAELGLEIASPEAYRLVMVNAVRVPPGIDEAEVRSRLLAEHGIEIGAGLGPLEGKIWRVGLMGASSTSENVSLFLSALQKILSL